MSCIICQRKVRGKKKLDCNCEVSFHKKCYDEFISKTNMNCPYCRIKKVKQPTRHPLAITIFFFALSKLPFPISIIVIITVSLMFIFFIMPYLVLQMFMSKHLSQISYGFYLYLVFKITNSFLEVNNS